MTDLKNLNPFKRRQHVSEQNEAPQPPKAVTAPAPKRLKLNKTELMIFENLQQRQLRAGEALTNFALGLLAGEGVEAFAGANIDRETGELVYVELAQPIS